MKTIKKLLFASILVFTLSCTEDADTEKPVIDLIAPKEGAVLAIGDAHGIHFEMELSDNEGLASYMVEIHNNFNGHGHDQGLRSESAEPFFVQKVWDVSGKKNAHIHHHHIVIPADAAPGAYHLMVFCTDAAGNESHVARNISLSHEGGEEHHDH